MEVTPKNLSSFLKDQKIVNQIKEAIQILALICAKRNSKLFDEII